MSNDDSLANRLPGYSARHATGRARRVHRLGIVAVIVFVVAVGATSFALYSGSHGRSAKGAAAKIPSSTVPPATATATVAAVSVAAQSWALGAPLSGGTVLPGAAGQLVIMGGATTGDVLAQGIFILNTANGALTQVGDLTTSLDDSTGAVIGSNLVVFGGASPTVLDGVQSWALSNAGASSRRPPRHICRNDADTASNATAVVMGSNVYLVGGDSGESSDPEVLQTVNGTAFTTAGTLAIAVRSAAVAAVGDKLYIFGGVAEAGPDAGQPIDSIQVLNLATHKSSIVGKLPSALAGAAASSIDGQVLIAGGDSQSAPPATGSAGGGTGGTGAINGTAQTSSAIWTFNPKGAKVTSVGQLSTPVSYSAMTAVGTTMWLVGGATNGVPVAAVQTITAPPHP